MENYGGARQAASDDKRCAEKMRFACRITEIWVQTHIMNDESHNQMNVILFQRSFICKGVQINTDIICFKTW